MRRFLRWLAPERTRPIVWRNTGWTYTDGRYVIERLTSEQLAMRGVFAFYPWALYDTAAGERTLIGHYPNVTQAQAAAHQPKEQP